MALRLANKINRNIVQDIIRCNSLLGTKPQTQDENNETVTQLTKPYVVYKPRTVPVQVLKSNVRSEVEVYQDNVRQRSLQPNCLPHYFSKRDIISRTNAFRFAGCSSSRAIDLNKRVIPAQQNEDKQAHQLREHETTAASTSSDKNSTTPLSPLAAAQTHRSFSTKSGSPRGAHASRNDGNKNQQQQNTSNDKQPEKKKQYTKNCNLDDDMCPKFDLCNCEQAFQSDCAQKEYTYKECTKKEAPYPCFSEACYEEVYNKPSECRLCPWKPEEHPTFNQGKKKFHTISSQRFFSDANKGSKKRETGNTYENLKDFDHVGLCNPHAGSSENNVHEILFSDKREFSKTGGATYEMQRELLKIEDGGDIQRAIYQMVKDCPRENCKKFPFKPVTYEIVGNPPKLEDKCVKKKRKSVKDCPRDKCKIDCSSIIQSPKSLSTGDLPFNDPKGMLLNKNKKHDESHGRNECQLPSYEICDCPDEYDCPKKPIKNKVCPEDLLIPKGYKNPSRRKNRPKKKAFPFQIPPPPTAINENGTTKTTVQSSVLRYH